jgi:hypothetical protein
MTNTFKVRLDTDYYLADIRALVKKLQCKANRELPCIYVYVTVFEYNDNWQKVEKGTIKIYMRPKDLYLTGFEAENGISYFTDDCGIEKPANNSEIFTKESNYNHLEIKKIESLNIHDFQEGYFTILLNFTNPKDESDSEVCRAFGVLCLIISEAIRFYWGVAKKLVQNRFFDNLGDKFLPNEVLRVAKIWETLSSNNAPCVSVKHYDHLD